MHLTKSDTTLKLLCRHPGGSHLYGLETPASDFDDRGVCINTDAAKILGLDRFDAVHKVTDDEDYLFFELRHFLQMLRKGNTQALETLFAPARIFTYLDDRFQTRLRDNAAHFVDSVQLHDCLTGYIAGEKRLASGARPGREGGKRWKKLQEFGFSPSNYVQAMRLAYCGREFFTTGNFPVDLRDHDPGFRAELFDIKTNAAAYAQPALESRVADLESQMTAAFHARSVTQEFDLALANQVLEQFYAEELGWSR